MRAAVISICICTYKRPEALRVCLGSLLCQGPKEVFEVVVTDNDHGRSGEEVVSEFKVRFAARDVEVIYRVEPIQNIALARNRGCEAATGEVIAFIDDDEYAAEDWLTNMYIMMEESSADGVWGPVICDVPDSFPKWMRNSELFARRNPARGTIMSPGDLRTGNAMVRRECLRMRPGPFSADLGRVGGSDIDLFGYLQRRGCRFVWADDARVHEVPEENRKTIRWHVTRSYRGGWLLSKRRSEQYGCVGGILLLVRVLPSVLKAMVAAVVHCDNMRYAALMLLKSIAANAGCVGFYVGFRVEEYRGRRQEGGE